MEKLRNLADGVMRTHERASTWILAMLSCLACFTGLVETWKKESHFCYRY